MSEGASTFDRDKALRDISETLTAIKEARSAGGKQLEELKSAVEDLVTKQETLDKFLKAEGEEDQKKTLRELIDAVVEHQLAERMKAEEGRFSLSKNARILGLVDKTGFTLEQRMFMQEPELKRYYNNDIVSDLRAMQELWDEALIVGHILYWSKKQAGNQVGNLKSVIKETRAYKQFESMVRAMDTATSTEGAELIPTDFSAQILDVVAISLKIAATFGTVTMPTSPFKLPVATSDDVGFKAPESLSDNFLTEGNKISALTPGTTNVTFTAQKAGALAVFSEEVNEDAIIAVVPFLRMKLANAIANAVERAILDGDTAATHQDNDVSAATDARKLWNGIRKDVGPAANGVDLATLNLTNLRSLRNKLDPEFAEDSEQLVYTVAVNTMLELLKFPEFVTVDKFGPNATILRGQIGRIDNSPVLTSKYVRTDVAASGVNTSGGPNTKAVLYLYNRNAYMIGNRRGITIKFGEVIWTDQGILVATQRTDFQKVRAGKTVAAVGKNITVA